MQVLKYSDKAKSVTIPPKPLMLQKQGIMLKNVKTVLKRVKKVITRCADVSYTFVQHYIKHNNKIQ